MMTSPRPATRDLRSRRHLASFAFITLLLLSIFWPSPVVSTNRLCCNGQLTVDELSFLGREAPSWDVVFWCIAGIFALALLHSGDFAWRDFAEPWQSLRAIRPRFTRGAAATLAVSAIVVAVVWFFVDSPAVRWAERVQSDTLESWIRIANRFGGGMNPALVVGFFAVAGVVYRHRRWIDYAAAMAVAGLSAGTGVQIMKALVDRGRPELWLGPFAHAPGSATSFPSGHTVGAFALGGVLIFHSRSLSLRIAALLLASAVGLSRILAFRHWASDVVASACLGLLAAWVVSGKQYNQPLSK